MSHLYEGVKTCFKKYVYKIRRDIKNKKKVTNRKKMNG